MATPIVDLGFIEIDLANVQGAGSAEVSGTVQITATGSQATGQGRSESLVVKTANAIRASNRSIGVASSQGGAVSVRSTSIAVVKN